MDILNYIDKMQEMYGDKDPSSTVPGPRNMYSSGMLVKPNADGSRPGYAKNKMSGSEEQQAGNVAKKKARLSKIGELFINKDYNSLKTKTRKARMGKGSIDAGGVLNSQDKTMLNNIILGKDVKLQNALAKELGINRRYMIEVYTESERLKDEGKALQQSKAKLSQVKTQKEIFDEILNNKNATVESMAKKFKMTKKEITKESSKLLKNVYSQNVAIGKGPEFDINSRGQKTLKSWLPDNFETTDSFLNNFSNIKGLKNVQSENMSILIKNAYGDNPKKFTAAMKGLSEYNKLVNLLPEGLKLDLDHPLSKSFLKGSGVSPDKLLYVTPISREYNRGFKQSLSMAYDKALLNPNRDKKLIKTIENFANKIGVNIGKGSTKKLDFGTTSITKKTQSGLAEELAQNFKEQETARKNLAKFRKTKEGEDVIKQIFKSGRAELKIPKVDKKVEQKLTTLLGELGCPTAKLQLGGRVKFSNGSACVLKGKKKLNKGMSLGFDKTEGELAKKILQAGRGLGSAFALRNILGPAAIGFTVAAEAGLVGYDMLATGKSFKEAVGASLFNYALGDKTKIDNKKLRYQGYADAGVSENQIGKISAFENAIDEINNTSAEFNEENRLYNIAANQKGRGRMDPKRFKKIKQQQVENFYDQADKNKALIQDLARTQAEDRLNKAIDPMVPAIMSDADAKRKAMQMTKPSTVGFGNVMDTIFPSGFFSDTTYKEDRDKAVNYMPEVQEYYRGNRFARGGLSGGDTSGPPPESGPMSQGLRSLIKNGRKL
jgi:6-pyruvoyl-tetrahydropterin synthase